MERKDGFDAYIDLTAAKLGIVQNTSK